MILNPLTFLVLLLLGAAGVAAVSSYRPRLAYPAASALVLLFLLLWLVARSQLPLLFSWQAGSLPPLAWRVDAAAWPLSAALLLLLGGILLAGSNRPLPKATAPALFLLVGLGGLAALWADSLFGLVVAWTLLPTLWLLPAARGEERPLRRLALAWGSVLLLWLAASTLPAAAAAAGLEMRGWPPLTTTYLLFAGLWQLGAFPLHLWRPLAARLLPPAAALAHTAPAVAGALLLARLETYGGSAAAFALPLTLAGLVGLLLAAARAWTGQAEGSAQASSVAAALVLGQASLVLLADVWAGSEAVLAETRVLLLAGGILLLAAGRVAEDEHVAMRIGPLLAVVALAGLPLTAGFAGRSALYETWLAQGRWLLALVTALLHVPLVAAAVLLVQKDAAATGERPSPATLVAAAGLLLPGLGLFTLQGLADAGLLTWLAVLLPAAAGAALARVTGEPGPAWPPARLLRQAFALRLPLRPLTRIVRQGVGALGTALRAAILMLEGEGGMMWLLVLLVLVWLAR